MYPLVRGHGNNPKASGKKLCTPLNQCYLFPGPSTAYGKQYDQGRYIYRHHPVARNSTA